jgi:methoxymalonate biosynthesis acyl carrier protein
MSEEEEHLRRFLQDRIGDVSIDRDDDIFAAGLVSSLFALQLVMFVETEFGVLVEDSDLEIDNFRSIAAIESFVVRRRRSSESA